MGSFTLATRENLRLRMVLHGPPKSGKTFSGLAIAGGLILPGKKLAVIQAEHNSASMLAGHPGIPPFDTVNLDKDFAPQKYVALIEEAADPNSGYSCIMIDNLSNAWSGRGGLLQIHGQKTDGGENSWAAWRQVSPLHDQLVEAITECPIDIIFTLRSKIKYVGERNEAGKVAPRKVGLRPVQRKDFEYEPDILGVMDMDHAITIEGRCPALDGRRIVKPDAEIGRALREWLGTGKVSSVGPTLDDERAGKIRSLTAALGWDRERLLGLLAREGVSRIAALDRTKADRMIAYLESKAKGSDTGQAIAEPPAASPEPTPVAASGTAPPKAPDPNAPLDPETVDRLNSMGMLAGLTQPQWVAVLAKRNVTHTSHLTPVQAAEILANLDRVIANKSKAQAVPVPTEPASKPADPPVVAVANGHPPHELAEANDPPPAASPEEVSAGLEEEFEVPDATRPERPEPAPKAPRKGRKAAAATPLIPAGD